MAPKELNSDAISDLRVSVRLCHDQVMDLTLTAEYVYARAKNQNIFKMRVVIEPNSCI
jgi:hypothetical protein